MREVEAHCIRVGNLCYEMALILGWPEMMAYKLRWAGYLHDLGKYFVPWDILTKKGSLTSDEIKIIQQHPATGGVKYNAYCLVAKDPIDHHVYLAMLHHHERWDGKGYPHGLRGQQIDISAQLVSFADYMEAMTADRCYRPAFTFDEVMLFAMQERGKKWSSDLTDTLLGHAETLQRTLALSEI